MNTRIIAKFTAVVLTGVVVAMTAPGAVAQVYDAVPQWKEIGTVSVNQGNTFSTYVSATDDNGDALTYAGVNLPAGAAFNPATRIFSFTPTYNQLGSFPVTLSVTDGRSTPVYKTFYVSVTSNYSRVVYGGGQNDIYGNQAPYITETNSYYTIASGNVLDFTIRALDPEGSALVYTASNLPSGALFNQNSGRFTWNPVRGQRGTYAIQFSAGDGSLTSVPLNVTIVVDGGTAAFSQPIAYQQQPYFVTSPSLSATAGQTYVYNSQAISPNGTQLTYSLEFAPSGSYMNPSTGVMAWTAPANTTSGQTYQFAITATDASGSLARQTFTLPVAGGVAAIQTVIQYVTAKPAAAVTPTYATPTYTTPTYNVPANQVPVSPSQGGQTVTASQNAVYINTSHTIAQASYGQNAYAQAGLAGAFNINIRVNENQETNVSWDTNQPSKGEVVFGYTSQPSSKLLNYEFTTGSAVDFSSKHQFSLGTLDLNRTYYLRIIDRTGTAVNISDELIFIPMPYSAAQTQQVIPQASYGATASDSIGAVFSSGWFLLVLILIILALVIYLLATPPSKPERHIDIDAELPSLDIPGAH